MGWESLLRPATFGKVGFYAKLMRAQGGERLVVREVPFAKPDLLNLGPLPKRFTVTAWFTGEAWLFEREAFLTALDQASGTTQTLILPTKGPLQVKVGTIAYEDDEQVGAFGAVEVEFVVDDNVAAPFASSDTASSLLNNVAAMQQAIINAYLEVMGPLAQIGAVASYAANLLGSAASAFLALPEALLSGVISTFASAPTNPFTTASTVTEAFLDASDNAAAVLIPDPVAATAITGTIPASALPQDCSLGLAGLAAWGDSLPPAALSPTSLAIAQAAIVALVQQSAVLATASLYAQTTFPDSQSAVASRAQMSGLFDAVGATIADALQVDLYRAWVALSTLVTNDMVARAQNLPTLAPYSVRRTLPDVVLAQQLYQDASQADALAVLNNAVHPLFMPLTGVWLEAA